MLLILLIAPDKIIVTFNANGGTVDVTEKEVYVGKPYGDLPTPTRAGCNFDGWYTDATDGELITADSIAIQQSHGSTLYARWKVKQYTVTLTKGTGIAAVSGAGTYDYGTSVTVNVTLESGYSWVNWTGTYTSTSQSYTFIMPNSNVSLTANGKQAITYLFANGDDGSSIHGGFEGQPYTGFDYNQDDPDWLEAPSFTVSSSSIKLTGWGSRYGSIATSKKIDLTNYSSAKITTDGCTDYHIGFTQEITHLFEGPYVSPNVGTYTIDLSTYTGSWYLVATYKGKVSCTITQISLIK